MLDTASTWKVYFSLMQNNVSGWRRVNMPTTAEQPRRSLWLMPNPLQTLELVSH